MDKKISNYSFSLFGDFKDITVKDTESYKKLIDEFVKFDCFVSIENQVRFLIKVGNDGIPTPNQEVVRKPHIYTIDNSTEISFKDDRIDVIFYFEKNKKLSLTNVLDKLKSYFKVLEEILNLKVTRLSFILHSKFCNLTESDIKKVQQLFINTKLTFYDDSSLDNWNIQLIKKVQKSYIKGKINVITTVKNGSDKKLNKNVISLDYDINTEPLTDGTNFSNTKINAFIDDAVVIYTNIKEEVERNE